MGRWNGKKNRKKEKPEICITCNKPIKGCSLPDNRRIRRRVCQKCLKMGLEKDWGCTRCTEGDPQTGIFNHKPDHCPALALEVVHLMV